MRAASASPIPAGLGQLAGSDPARCDELPDLLSALRGDGIVLAQRDVDAKSNEITAFWSLLHPLDLTGAVVTFDALLTQTDHAKTWSRRRACTTSPCSRATTRLHAMVKDLERLVLRP
ncbi:hypothetical protein ACGFZR_01370 [Streptomyces sp. NPDC048241]|uniref:hypothetical protein n=1 Tax=Streptomyces sp. NPDC048241 TaxID=3365521 RepID=UPI00371D545C